MFYLKRNVPALERGLRVVAGLAGAGLALALAPSPVGMWAGVAAGLMFAVTGLVGYCPMCAMVGRKAVEARE
jgi:hypothetical protein